MTPDVLALLLILIGLTVYTLFAGADFGAGIWQVNTALSATKKERSLLYGAIGPVWEANHVWLIFVVVMLFGAFPAAFATICQALWLPLVLALAGIVFRGAGFAFRSYSVGAEREQFGWEVVFAVGSTAAPFFLGMAVGALASGRLVVTEAGEFDGNYATGWVSPLALFMGFFTVGMCAFLTAVFLVREAHQQGDAQLTDLWRSRALATGIWMGILTGVGLLYVSTDAPLLWDGFQRRSGALVAGSVVAGLATIVSLVSRWYRAAVFAACAAVTAVIWGWALAQYPWLVPPTITIEEAKAPDRVLWFLIATAACGALLLVPALGYLMWLFKVGRRQGH